MYNNLHTQLFIFIFEKVHTQLDYLKNYNKIVGTSIFS